MTKKQKLGITGIITGVIVLLLAAFLPLPYLIERPGTTESVSQMVHIKNTQTRTTGGFYLTTVQLMQGTPLDILFAKTQPFYSVQTVQSVRGNLTDRQFTQVNQYYMQTAQNTAIHQAFKLANLPYEIHFQGVYVLGIAKNSTFKKFLEISDTITGINDQTFKSSADLIAYASSQKVGQVVKIHVIREDGRKHSFTGKYIRLDNGNTGIGVSLTDHTELKTEPPVKIDAGDIGGPSAGMMFTLEIYSQILGQDLVKGRQIAGTGTIEEDGKIGQIGGVDKKVATAGKKGADLFLVPDSGTSKKETNNYLAAQAAAKKAGSRIKIIPVKTIQDALEALKS